MTTSIPSGLGASVGFTAEGTVGTALTSSMRFMQVDKVTAEYDKSTTTSTGLHQGLYQQGKRRAFMTKSAKVQVTMDAVANKMGLLFKHAIGSSASATQMASTTVYQQIHAPGDTLGLGLTVQVNKPFTSGTLQQFTYSGCKIIDWQLSVQRGQLAKWDMTLDSWWEDTSTGLAAVSYVATDVFDFHEGAILVGGTPAVGPPVTVSGGAAPTGLVSQFSLKGTNGLADSRFNLGSQTKKEQLSNAFRQITGTFDVEFSSAYAADAYTAFIADTATTLEFSLTGPIPSGGVANHELIDVILPQVYIDSVVWDVGGPDIITGKVGYTVLDDATTQPIQVIYQSTDTTV